MKDNPDLISPEYICQRLKISVFNLLDLVISEKLTPIQIPNRRTKFSLQELESYIEQIESLDDI